MFKRFLILILSLSMAVSLSPQQKEKTDREKEKEKDVKLPLITESITVQAKAPKDLPYATTSTVQNEIFELFKPKELTEVISFTSGTYVSTGSKNEWSVKIRGLANNRITLLYDGIPIYEPYYNSFDLKAISTDQIESIKVVKGASSVLYGANALGGIVDVVSRRPQVNNLSLKLDYGDNQTFGMYANGAITGKSILFTPSFFRETSDGFDYISSEKNIQRSNSDYKRTQAGGKLYYYPKWGGEILAEVNYYQSEYGIPEAVSFTKPRFWRFKDWQRLIANLGGSFSLFNDGYIKTRFYYVKHHNVLDAYKSNSYDNLQWESTYDNYAVGAFVLGMVPLGKKNELNISLNYRDDHVNTQADLNSIWEKYVHKTSSLGIEDHFRLHEKVELMAGASLDHLNKQNGKNKTTLNPILGIKFNPNNNIDLHLTLSQKSRFPSMKNLYSGEMGGGNPDLKDEKGTNIEAGFTFHKGIVLSGAVFSNRIHDMIDRKPIDGGLYRYDNISRARIQGLEFEISKSFGPIYLSANYTYLDTQNLETEERLDVIPASQLNAMARFYSAKLFSLTLWGLHASDSIVHGSPQTVTLPSYTVINIALERDLGPVNVYVKVDNLLNENYSTDAGFPMKARTIMAGFRFLLQAKAKTLTD